MNYLEGFLEETDANDKCIQRALREIDENTLLYALCDLDEASSQAIVRNMSKRAAQELLADLEIRKPTIGTGLIRFGREEFLQKLRKFRKYAGDSEAMNAVQVKPEPNGAQLEEPAGIVEFFVSLGDRLKGEDAFTMEALISGCKEKVAKKGLEYLADGLDPMLIRSLLERIKETALREASKYRQADVMESLPGQCFPPANTGSGR